MRTQDLITLENNQSFVLHGRVPSAVLKGCSLSAEELLQNTERVAATTTQSSAEPAESSEFKEEQIQKTYIFLKDFFAEKSVHRELTELCCSEALAKSSVKDLLLSFLKPLRHGKKL